MPAMSKAVPMEARMAAVAPVHPPGFRPPPVETARYGKIEDNPVRLVSAEPVSTFSIDVDTGSYANVRRFLRQGRLPRQTPCVWKR